MDDDWIVAIGSALDRFGRNAFGDDGDVAAAVGEELDRALVRGENPALAAVTNPLGLSPEAMEGAAANFDVAGQALPRVATRGVDAEATQDVPDATLGPSGAQMRRNVRNLTHVAGLGPRVRAAVDTRQGEDYGDALERQRGYSREAMEGTPVLAEPFGVPIRMGHLQRAAGVAPVGAALRVPGIQNSFVRDVVAPGAVEGAVEGFAGSGPEALAAAGRMVRDFAPAASGGMPRPEAYDDMAANPVPRAVAETVLSAAGGAAGSAAVGGLATGLYRLGGAGGRMISRGLSDLADDQRVASAVGPVDQSPILRLFGADEDPGPGLIADARRAAAQAIREEGISTGFGGPRRAERESGRVLGEAEEALGRIRERMAQPRLDPWPPPVDATGPTAMDATPPRVPQNAPVPDEIRVLGDTSAPTGPPPAMPEPSGPDPMVPDEIRVYGDTEAPTVPAPPPRRAPSRRQQRRLGEAREKLYGAAEGGDIEGLRQALRPYQRRRGGGLGGAEDPRVPDLAAEQHRLAALARQRDPHGEVAEIAARIREGLGESPLEGVPTQGIAERAASRATEQQPVPDAVARAMRRLEAQGHRAPYGEAEDTMRALQERNLPIRRRGAGRELTPADRESLGVEDELRGAVADATGQLGLEVPDQFTAQMGRRDLAREVGRMSRAQDMGHNRMQMPYAGEGGLGVMGTAARVAGRLVPAGARAGALGGLAWVTQTGLPEPLRGAAARAGSAGVAAAMLSEQGHSAEARQQATHSAGSDMYDSLEREMEDELGDGEGGTMFESLESEMEEELRALRERSRSSVDAGVE